MHRTHRREDGSSTLELALVLPVLLLFLTVGIPLLKGGWEYMVVSRSAAHGVRYATRVDTNPRTSAVGLTRRPTADEVDSFVREAASPLELSTVTVSPEPVSALSGDLITVRATYRVSFGPLAGVANGLKESFFGGGQFLPEFRDITVSARGREE